MPNAHRGREFLDVEFAKKVFERAAEGHARIFAVHAERYGVFGGGEGPTFRSFRIREIRRIHAFGVDAKGFLERAEEGFLKRRKFLGLPLEEFVFEILEERFGN